MTTASPDTINALVARYARIGKRRRQDRWVTISAAVVCTPLLIFGGIKATEFITQQNREQSNYAAQNSELRELGSQLRSEIDAMAQQRIELEQRSAAFEQQSASLAAKLAELDLQRERLEQQGQAFDAQREQLTAALENADRQRIELAQQRAAYSSNAPAIQQEISALNAQRLELQAQQREFKAQSEQLGNELNQINAQRVELEQQQQQVEQQRQAVDEILEQVSALRDRRQQRIEQQRPAELIPLDTGDEEAIAFVVPVNPSLDGMASVNDSELGNMRGGISIGGDMNIAVGLTRSASINGNEEYSSSLHIDNLNASLSAGDLANVNSVLIQNGAGNVASPAILDALSGNYATVIQNSLDNQEIATQTVLDISIGNVSGTLRGLAAQQAISDSLSLQR